MLLSEKLGFIIEEQFVINCKVYNILSGITLFSRIFNDKFVQKNNNSHRASPKILSVKNDDKQQRNYSRSCPT